MKKWQIENSETSEILEILFRVFLFPSFRFCPTAKIENSDINISENFFRDFRVFDLAFRSFDIVLPYMILKNRYSQICTSWRKCAFFEEKNKQQNKTNKRKYFDILIYFCWLLCHLHLKNFSMGSCKFSWSQFMEFKHNEKYKNGGFGRTSRSWFHVFFFKSCWNASIARKYISTLKTDTIT